MSEVYFSENIDKIIENIDYSRLGSNVAIKVHFGEAGCNTYLNPSIVKKVYDKIISLGKKASLVECNVLYRGSRTNSTEHIKTAKSHGFDFAPIDILDGERGQDFVEFNGCKLGAGLAKYDSMIVLSHFKGHMMAGFGGAIKNISMGLASRAGKLALHSNVRPSVNARCVGCGVCIENCNAKAISLIIDNPPNKVTIDRGFSIYPTPTGSDTIKGIGYNGKAKINPDLCEGCAMCIAVCKSGAIQVPWAGETPAGLQRKIVDYALGIKDFFKEKIVYINVLQNITKDCDCMGVSQNPVMKDIGFLLSEDIVSVDKASLDLANKNSAGKFNSINGIDKEKQIDYAVSKKLGSKEYGLVELK